jgi:alkylation response protein AidB-like acyl-CoA dehydrogenase
VDLRDTPEEAQFRAGLRDWIQANLPESNRGGRGGAQRFEEFGREWSRKLYDAGYAGLTWPRRTATRRSSTRRWRPPPRRRTSA